MNTYSAIPASLPLAKNLTFQSPDPAELESFLESGDEFEKRRLTLLDRNSGVNAHLSISDLTRLRFIGVHIGANVIARSVPLDAAQILIPVHGKVLDRTRGASTVAQSGQSAVVHMPNSPVEVQWDENTSALVIRIPADYLKGIYQALTDDDWPEQLQLRPRFSLVDVSGRSFFKIIENLISAINTGENGLQTDFTVGLWEELLVTTLLTTDAAVGERLAKRENKRPVYGYVKRATDYIHENLASSFSLHELAREVGVSLRTLQSGFRKSHGTSPMAFVRRKKLEQVRRELLAPAHCAPVIAEIAASWGFTHASYFTRIYKEAFRELPSDTVARAVGKKTADGDIVVV